MAIESIVAGLGGAVPPAAAPQQGGAEAFEAFRPASPEASAPARTARLGGPAEASIPPRHVTEVSASPSRDGGSLSERMLDRLDVLQRGDAAWSRPDVTRVASADPGPAAMHLRPAPADTPALSRPPGEGAGPTFDGMMDQLRQMSGQVVQVSIVTKTTSSFTGSLNKLLSSG